MTSTYLPDYPVEGYDDATRRHIPVVHAPVDRLFRGIGRGAGTVVLAIMTLVGVFLSVNAVRSIASIGIAKFVTTQEWSPETKHFGIAAVLTGTVLIAIVALVIAVPLSLGASLFITELTAGRLQSTMRSMIDLMAAVPSLVYGLWGLAWLQPKLWPLATWISTYFGWIPLFKVTGADPSNPLPNPALYESSTFIAGLVVGMMIVPIQTSIMVETFSRAPQGEREGAYALGATKWGMIRRVVLPFGKVGIIGGVMLGLGRALGETIAIYLIISPLYHVKLHILQKGGDSVAAMIAQRSGETNPFTMSALMAAGLSLFVLTMAINFTASTIMARSRSGAESEG